MSTDFYKLMLQLCVIQLFVASMVLWNTIVQMAASTHVSQTIN